MHLGIKISRQTLLRLVMKTPLTSRSVPKVLGVDDWAYRKRHTYGTILVDLETHQPVDLLSDRTASTLAEWLQTHPGVEIISRDRAKAYKEGASSGCPEAIQVADRFHLLQNLAQMLELVLNQHRTLLKKVEDSTNNSPVVDEEEVIAKPVPAPSQPKDAVELAKFRRAERKEKYDQVWALHKKGYKGKAISLLKQQDPNLKTAIELAMDFADLVRRKQPDKLKEWLQKAEQSKIRAITGFATKLKDDLDAVKNGVTLSWSNGQVEGQVNRLKMLKRQMYGRASHELLKRRFLCPI